MVRMSIKPDKWIIRMSKEKGMIIPFAEAQVRKGVISFGVGSYGYDFRIADEFQIPKVLPLLDPKNIQPGMFGTKKADFCIIPPGSFILGKTVEYFKIPRDIVTICTGKSTYARVGVIVNVTPFEPEWEGYATISIVNSSSSPVKIYANEGIGQLIFLEATEVCDISYADKKGKYQAQKTITHARL